MSTKFVQLFSALLLFSSAFCAQFELQRIDLFQRLGFNESTNSTTADDNFDAFLAFGSSLYTARLGVGTPAQPIDFLLNFVGDMISPGVGDISFVLTPTAKFNETLAFVSGDSSTFLPRPDITFKTAIQFNPLQMKVRGGLGEDIITFKDSQTNATYLIRENRLGQIDQIQGQLFDQLNIGGIINMGKRSLLYQNINSKASSDRYALYLDDRRGMLLVGNEEKEFCRDPFASVEMVKAEENQTETGIQNTLRIEINGLFMQTPESTHTDREKKIALINPNSPFIQGPRKTVTQLAFMVDAEKVQIGRHQLYTINCNQSYGPLQFNFDYKITLPKNSLRIELPGNLLPEGQCLWGIQELPLAIAQFNNAEWVIGRPYFKENCMAIYPYNGNIAFSGKKR